MIAIQDEWSIIEEGFDPERHEACESLFSIGNGHMGQRANFEEHYSGPSLQALRRWRLLSDKTRVGCGKTAIRVFRQSAQCANWIGVD